MALWITAGILSVAVLLLMSPLSLRVNYEGKLRVELCYLFLRFRLLPPKEKKEPAPSSNKKSDSPTDPQKTPSPSLSKKELISLLFQVVRMSGTALKKAMRAVTVDVLEISAVIVREDPFDTAVGYGRMNLYVYSALGALNNLCKVRVRAISIAPDFTRYGTGDQYHLDLKAKIRLGTAVGIVLQLGWKFFWLILKQQKRNHQDKAVQ